MRHVAIMLSHPSSGTRMLGSAINSHPCADFFFECVDSNDADFFAKAEAEAKERKRLYLFDVKYHHCSAKVWAWMCKEKPPTLHLVRLNTFELACSELKRQTRTLVPCPPLRLMEMRSTVAARQQYWHQELLTASVPALFVPYEDVCPDSHGFLPLEWDNTISRFLNLSAYPRRLKTEEKKAHQNWKDKIILLC